MVELLIPTVTEQRVGLLEATIRGVFGAVPHMVRVRTDLEPWLVAVIFPGHPQALTAAMTPEQAGDARCRQVLAREFRVEADRLRWTEAW